MAERLQSLVKDPDFLSLDDREREIVFDRVAAEDPDYAGASPALKQEMRRQGVSPFRAQAFRRYRDNISASQVEKEREKSEGAGEKSFWKRTGRIIKEGATHAAEGALGMLTAEDPRY